MDQIINLTPSRPHLSYGNLHRCGLSKNHKTFSSCYFNFKRFLNRLLPTYKNSTHVYSDIRCSPRGPPPLSAVWGAQDLWLCGWQIPHTFTALHPIVGSSLLSFIVSYELSTRLTATVVFSLSCFLPVFSTVVPAQASLPTPPPPPPPPPPPLPPVSLAPPPSPLSNGIHYTFV